MHVRVGEIRALIKAGEPWGVSVNVEPSENEVAQGLFGALSNWASDVEVPKWQQKWLEYKFIAGKVRRRKRRASYWPQVA